MAQKSSLATRFNLYTIIAVYFLILVGGIVRTMGAGMGCPDWPKCFGKVVPPTDASALPENYEELYVESRMEKNQRLANLLNGLGMSGLSKRVASDPTIREVTTFDATKAWVEYVNRLIGVIIGFLIILNVFFSFRYWSANRSVTALAIASFILVVFQGWVGSLVVSTNLLPGFISFHMLLALLLVSLLIWQHYLMHDKSGQVKGRGLLITILALFTIQIVFGIQVREQVDVIKATTDLSKADWVENLGSLFYVHRSYSLLLVGLIGWLLYKNIRAKTLNTVLVALAGVVILEIILGAIMSYFAFPKFAQPGHLLLGTIAFGLIFYLFLSSTSKATVN